MRVVCISDLHGLFDNLVVPECDVLVVAGDVVHDSSPHNVSDFSRWARRQKCRRVLMVAGNHDRGLFDRSNLLSLPGVVHLFDSGCKVDGIKFWGFPWQLVPGASDSNGPYIPLGTYQECCRRIPLDTDVVISHARLHFDVMAPRRRFKLHVFGHRLGNGIHVPWDREHAETPWIFASLSRTFAGDQKTKNRRAIVASVTVAEFDADKHLVSITREPAFAGGTSHIPRGCPTSDQEPVVAVYNEWCAYSALGFEREIECDSPTIPSSLYPRRLDDYNPIVYTMKRNDTSTKLVREAAKRAGITPELWLRLRIPGLARNELLQETRDLPPLP